MLDTFVTEAVASQDELFELGLLEDENLKQWPATSGVDVAVAEGQRLHELVILQALSQSNHSVATELVVVQLKDGDRWTLGHGSGKHLAHELAAEGRDLAVEELEAKHTQRLEHEVTDGAHSLVLAVSLPQADRAAVGIAIEKLDTKRVLT